MVPATRAHSTKIKLQLKDLKAASLEELLQFHSFSPENIASAMVHMREGRAPGIDGIYLQLCSKYTKERLRQFFTNIVKTFSILHGLKRQKLQQSTTWENNQPQKTLNRISQRILSVIFTVLHLWINNNIGYF